MQAAGIVTACLRSVAEHECADGQHMAHASGTGERHKERHLETVCFAAGCCALLRDLHLWRAFQSACAGLRKVEQVSEEADHLRQALDKYNTRERRCALESRRDSHLCRRTPTVPFLLSCNA